MGNFFTELKRHHIYRVTAAYAVVAWLLLQLVNNVAPVLDLPAWVARACLLLLVLGFPLAVFFAWTRQVPAADASAPMSTTITDWALIGVLIVVLGLVSYQQFAPSGMVTKQPGVEAAKAAAATPSAAIAIAVLPFANMSGDATQEFFSDGMTEEITSALAKVPDLRVVARTSAFEFKGKNVGVDKIGQQLHATHLIEGSVRKAGNRLRITAQLIKSDDGTHIWAEDYDRELTDVFAIQEDIARAITASLRMPLGLKPGENLVNNRNVDVEVYQQFLRLRAQARTLPPFLIVRNVLPEFEKLVAREPNFAPAWAYLSRVYSAFVVPLYNRVMTRPPEDTRRLLQPGFDKVQKAAREAIRLDPRQAVAYASLAQVEINEKHWASAEDLLRKAQELDPYNSDVLDAYGTFLLLTGRIKDTLHVLQQAHELEPLGSVFALSQALMADNQPATAIPMLETVTTGGVGHLMLLSQAYAMAGRFNDAANSIPLTAQADNFIGDHQALEQAAELIRTAPRKAGDPSTLRALPGDLNFVYGYVGAPDRLLDYPERTVKAGLVGINWFGANYTPVRKTERFKGLMREVGLVDYWKDRGWPDMCHPTTGDDFECN
jgi:TolB-like protein